MNYIVRHDPRVFIRRSPAKRNEFNNWETEPLYRVPRGNTLLLGSQYDRLLVLLETAYVVVGGRQLGVYRVIAADLLTNQWRAGIWQAVDEDHGVIAALISWRAGWIVRVQGTLVTVRMYEINPYNGGVSTYSHARLDYTIRRYLSKGVPVGDCTAYVR